MEELLAELQAFRFPHTLRTNVLQPYQSKYEGFVLGYFIPRSKAIINGTSSTSNIFILVVVCFRQILRPCMILTCPTPLIRSNTQSV